MWRFKIQGKHIGLTILQVDGESQPPPCRIVASAGHTCEFVWDMTPRPLAALSPLFFIRFVRFVRSSLAQQHESAHPLVRQRCWLVCSWMNHFFSLHMLPVVCGGSKIQGNYNCSAILHVERAVMIAALSIAKLSGGVCARPSSLSGTWLRDLQSYVCRLFECCLIHSSSADPSM
mmetsp:Transcript_4051/g.5869  ORF Transcript_4051/g.5869 Transcript_4051/m.5869 type:complete len:175 (+) Transcript_4051:156-680(+)